MSAPLTAEVERHYRAAHGGRPDAWSPARVAAWVAAQVAAGGELDPATLHDALEWDAHADAEYHGRGAS